MPLPQTNDRLSSFLRAIALRSPEALKDAFMNEVMESGGSYVEPVAEKGVSYLYEISLHGVLATGASEEEAVRSWIREAAKAARLEIAATAL